MSKTGNNSSFYAYTKEWIDAINRGRGGEGGLFIVNVEISEVTQSVLEDREVRLQWRSVGASIVDEEDAIHLLCGMWVTMRGFECG